MTIEDRRALKDANGRLLAALGRVGDRCQMADRVAVVGHRLERPGVRDGHDPVGLVYAVTEALTVLAEAVDVGLARVPEPPTPKHASARGGT